MIRFCIIGRNFIVDYMMAAMAAVDEVKPVAIYSRKQEDAEAFAEKYGLEHAFSDLNALGSCPDVDAVYIASPNSLHYEQSMLMLKSGKHVLDEKPAASNARQLRKMVDLARERGLVFLEAMRPVYNELPGIIRENLPKIGTLRQIHLDYSKISSRMNLFREKGNAVNTFNPALSNAAVMDLGCYGIHTLIHLFGKPDAVSAQAIHLDNGFEACGTVVMRYAGFTADVSYSKIFNLDRPSVLVGEKGRLFLDHVNNTERIWLDMDDGTVTDIPFTPAKPNDMIYELRAFSRFIDEKRQPIAENEVSILTADTLDEVRKQTDTVFPADFE